MNAPASATTAARPTFSEVYAAHLDYVLTTLRRLGAPPSVRADLAHDVFLVVFRRLGEFDPERAMRPWLFGIASRVARDHRRRASSVREVLDPEIDDTDPRPSQEDAIDAWRRRRLLERALAALDEDAREILILAELDGVSGPEIAQLLGVPTNTAYSRLRLARAKLVKVAAELLSKGGMP